MASKQIIKLTERIKEEFGLDFDPERFQRSYGRGYSLSSGNYGWYITRKEMDIAIVGNCRIKDCIVKKIS